MSGKRTIQVHLRLLTALWLSSVAAAQDTLNVSEVCAANPLVDVYGTLTWGEDHAQGIPAPYDLKCPDLHLRATEKSVTVQASDIKAALAAFAPGALFLSYFENLYVRYDGAGHLNADPVRNVPEEFIDDIFRVRVTVTPRPGEAHVLFKNAMPSPLTLPPGQAFTIDITATDTAHGMSIPWGRTEIDPSKGTITVTRGQ